MTGWQYTVRILDTDKDFCSTTDHFLTTHSYQSKVFHNSASFLADLSDERGCALIALSLEQQDGIDFITEARLAGYDAPIIIVSASGNVSKALRAGRSGAFEFLRKPVRTSALLDVVNRACEAHLHQRLAVGSLKESVDCFKSLTNRERQVFWLLADGCITKAVADSLSISIRTAEAHRSRVLEKFRTRKVSDLVRASKSLLFLNQRTGV